MKLCGFHLTPYTDPPDDFEAMQLVASALAAEAQKLSLGTIVARRVIALTETMAAIALLCSMQALDLRADALPLD